MRFQDFTSHVKNEMKKQTSRQAYADTLDEWMSQAIKEENWPAAEAFMAGILRLDPDRFEVKARR